MKKLTIEELKKLKWGTFVCAHRDTNKARAFRGITEDGIFLDDSWFYLSDDIFLYGKPQPNWDQLIKDNSDGVKVRVRYNKGDFWLRRYLSHYKPQEDAEFFCYKDGMNKFTSGTNSLVSWKFCELWEDGLENSTILRQIRNVVGPLGLYH